MIVCKFGGTSVQDADAIGRLVSIVRARLPEEPLVIVSALAGVTDELLRLGGLVTERDRRGLVAGISVLVERHRVVAGALAPSQPVTQEIHRDGARLLTKLSPALGKPLTPRMLDALAGRGELWSAWLVEAALRHAGLPARWVDSRTIVITDSRFGRATPERAEIGLRARTTLVPLLRSGELPVMQGFAGATLKGVPTTLGRGGSDFTAALLGAALGAERVEIWTDVDGLMTADPRLVPAARTLEEASYDEAAELSTFGAKVLHPATQLPLVEAGIPIVVLNSRRPDLAGTTIKPNAELKRLGNSPVRSISYKKGITVVNIQAPRMLGAFGFLRALFEAFERNEVVVDVVATSEVSVSLTIEQTGRLEPLLKALAPLGQTWVDTGRAIVAVVGVGLRDTPGVAARVFAAVAPSNVEIISQGASEINLTFVVAEADGPDIVRRLHREFFEV